MNTRNLKLFALLLLMASAAPVRSQSTVLVQQIINFPDLPNDTAYEGLLYDFDIVVQNGTNSVVTGSMTIQMRVDSIITALGTPAIQVTLNPGDTMVVSVNQYPFLQPQFKAGNNIVVVWPSINSGITYPIDSLTTDVYYVPLNSVGIPSEEPLGFKIFPNPANDIISWTAADGSIPERVRIYDASGRLAAEINHVGLYAVSSLPEGMYVVVLEYGHRIVRERFVKW